MDDILYLEVDEEIPSVIEKLSRQSTDDVVLVVPTGAALLSSIVNVKLLKRTAEREKKRLAIVTTDPIGRHVAAQVGVPVYVSVKDRRVIDPPRMAKPVSTGDELDLRTESAAESGVAVNHYGEGSIPPKRSQSQPPRAVGFAAREISNELPIVPEPAAIAPPERPAAASYGGSRKVAFNSSTATQPARHHRRRLIVMGTALSLLAVVLASAWYYYPSAIVGLTVATEPYTGTAEVVIDTSKQFATDTSGKTLLGERLDTTADSSKDTPTTGKKDVGTKSQGTADLQNRLGQAVKLSSGTSLAGTSVSFVTIADVTIPAATATIDSSGGVVITPGKATVAVTAAEAGENGNVSAGTTFSVRGAGSTVQDKVSATATAAFTGGTSKEVSVVTQTDLDHAKELAVEDATKVAKAKVAASLADRILLEHADRIQVVNETPSAKLDDQVDTVTNAVSVKYEAIVFDNAAFRDTVTTQLNQATPAGKMVVLTTGDQVTTTVLGTDWAVGTLSLKSSIATRIAPQIDTSAVVALIRGKSLGAAQAALANQPAIQRATFTLRPIWFPQLPVRLQAFQIQFSQPDDTSQ